MPIEYVPGTAVLAAGLFVLLFASFGSPFNTLSNARVENSGDAKPKVHNESPKPPQATPALVPPVVRRVQPEVVLPIATPDPAIKIEAAVSSGTIPESASAAQTASANQIAPPIPATPVEAANPAVAPSKITVNNGSFENGTTGWTVTSSDANPAAFEVRNDQGKTDGLHALVLGTKDQAGNAIISQTIQTASGVRYTLRFNYGAFGTSGKTQQLRVEALNGALVLESKVVTANGPNNFLPASTTFQTFTFEFTAASAATVIRFTDQTTLANSFSCDGALDFVSLSGGIRRAVGN